MPLMIAACSNRKRSAPEARAASLLTGPIEVVGREWLDRLAPLSRMPAGHLYCGRSVRDAERAASLLGADLLFASAGLGWVRATDEVPSYGMTIVAGEDSVLARIEGQPDAGAWWRWLNDHSPLAARLAEVVAATKGLVLVALPSAYLAMVEEDLLALPDADRDRLRIIQRRGTPLRRLGPWTLVYDDRLEASDGHAGTRSDFASRAACHFVEQVLPGREQYDVAAHDAAVQAALSPWTARPVRIGERRSDEELRQVVTQHWEAAGGRTTRLLRILRDDLGIACEQGRFARLVSAMRTERESIQ